MLEKKHFKWIVFEGMEGAGKTTLVRNLGKYLLSHNNFKNHVIQITAEPSLDVTAEIKAGLPKEAILFLNSGSRKKLRNLIKNSSNLSPAKRLSLFLDDRERLLGRLKVLPKHSIVIQDRCYVSTLVYDQLYLDIDSRELMENNQVVFNKAYNIRPDLLVYLHVSPEESIKRLQKRKKYDVLDKKALENLDNIYNNYQKLFVKKGLIKLDPYLKDTTEIVTIDTTDKFEEEVLDETIQLIHSLFETIKEECHEQFKTTG